jgi:adenine-specific DNA-methyltransferase
MAKNYDNYSKEELITHIHELEKQLKNNKYGIYWDKNIESEKVISKCKDEIPIFIKEDNLCITTDTHADTHILIEGDNFHALSTLNMMCGDDGFVDIIYIDPPYNRGENDFIYNDNYVDKEDGYRHSKWLSFMSTRLELARNLLSNDGIIIVNIDEHEDAQLQLLLTQIFGENNRLGTIIWNKMNPKGDAHGISSQHESILCYAKNKMSFLENKNTCTRMKPNAEKMLRKAKALFNKIGKRTIPEDVAVAIKPFNYSKEIKKDFKVTYDLDLINKEFQNWLKNQNFSGGEKAYKYIDKEGKVYRGVSMAWPNKKKAPDEYFIPLIHPITGKPCPVPSRGWRNPPNTMKALLENGRIIFGKDENKQPERKYLLEENMFENTPSIYENADSADNMLKKMNIKFEYPKPVSEAMYVLNNIHPNPKIILDFFAGSGTTGHAVLELNKKDDGHRKFILCTNNENNICTEVTYPRINTVISGKCQDGSEYGEGISANLMYYKTDFIKDSEDTDQAKYSLVEKVDELLCITEETYIEKERTDYYSHYETLTGDKHTFIYSNFYNKESFLKFIELIGSVKGEKIIYMFSTDNIVDEKLFENIPDVIIKPIPNKIYEIYKEIVEDIKRGE